MDETRRHFMLCGRSMKLTCVKQLPLQPLKADALNESGIHGLGVFRAEHPP